jgi:hypothetical protein
MNASLSCRFVSVLALFPLLVSAQFARQHDPVALKHWAAPLYWQPTQASGDQHALAAASNSTPLPGTANLLVFVAMPPCRVVDTRRSTQPFDSALGPPSLSAGAVRTFPILSSTCTIPSAAQAYSFNITVVPPGPLAYITGFPTGQNSPIAAVAVESSQGFMLSSAGIIPAGTNGSVDLYASDATDIVIDINGYYAALTSAENTMLGMGALSNNTTGGRNTALGLEALANNTTGSGNTATGTTALQSNTTGIGNTAIGNIALAQNTTGTYNTANGDHALSCNTTGHSNTASGENALSHNTSGRENTAIGLTALDSNITGNGNTAIGVSALGINTTGNNNIAVGIGAGSAIMTGSNNITIGTEGLPSDSNTIRIGRPAGQTSFFAVGIRAVTTGKNDAIPVVIDSNGQLGTVNSSQRFKEDIHDMGTESSDLMRLRPVTFRYQKPFADGSKPIQYGLIAEEVAEVYPELIARSADGQIETVKYQVLDSMLLNELQKEHRQLQQQAETIRLLQTRLAALEEVLCSGFKSR